MFLQGILLLVVLLLLLSAVWIHPRIEEEKYFWAKLVLLYLLCLLTLTIGKIPLPIGLALGLWFVSAKSRFNISMKRLALVFGFAAFMVTQIIPVISLEDLQGIREKQHFSKRFQNVYAVHDYEPSSPIQKKISSFVEDRTDVDAGILMMRTWVLQQKNIKIKGRKWLLSDAADELEFWWHSSRRDKFNTTYEFIEFHGGKGYFGVFKQDDKTDRYYLDLLIEFDDFKNSRPTIMGNWW